MERLRGFSKTLQYLVAGTRGGPMRARILSLLMEKPQNPNQLAAALKVDYKTIQHHLEMLGKNNWVVRAKEKYGENFATTFTPEEQEAFEAFLGKLGKKLK